MKINLGSGYKKYDDFINIDDDPLVKPDICLDINSAKLPFEDNSVDEIKAHHILEHIGEPFIPLMKELYRVCKHGALLDIEAPHHQHEVFYGDPTHRRPITVMAMDLFSKKANLKHIASLNSSSGMGLKYDIDFEIVHYEYEYDEFYKDMIANFYTRRSRGEVDSDEDFMITRLLREATNVALNVKIIMMAVKE